MGENQGLNYALAGLTQNRQAAIFKPVSGNPDAYPT
jgi:hypothetical protein